MIPFVQDPSLQARLPLNLLCALPPIIEQRQNLLDIDYYGASSVIASQIGMSCPSPSLAIWKHGWRFTPIRDVAQLTGTQVSAERMYLMNNDTESSLLRFCGFRSEPIGLPFLYALREPHTAALRVPGSILVMPMHGTTHTQINSQDSIFIDSIASLTKHASCVVACVSGMCVLKGEWIGMLEDRGIPWLTGAWVFDANGLRRMRAILQVFDYVLTNSFGSHVLYAAACGCKVACDLELALLAQSIPQLLANEPLYQYKPQLLAGFAMDEHQEYLVNRYPWFFRGLSKAKRCQSWAYKHLGLPFWRDPRHIADLFGW